MTHADQAMILPQGNIISLFNGIPTETTGAIYLGDMQHHMIWFPGKALPDHVLLHRLGMIVREFSPGVFNRATLTEKPTES